MIVRCVQRGFTAHIGCILIVIRSNNCNSNFDINDKREELPNKHLAKLHINFILYHKKFPWCKFDDFFGRKLHDKGISVSDFQIPNISNKLYKKKITVISFLGDSSYDKWLKQLYMNFFLSKYTFFMFNSIDKKNISYDLSSLLCLFALKCYK